MAHIVNVMLVGKTGSGKSSLANSMFGLTKEEGYFFKVAEEGDMLRGRLSTEPQAHVGKINKTKFRLIDTPGFFDSDLTVAERWFDILKAVSLAGGSLDAIILVISVRQLGAGARCLEIVRENMMEFLIDRLVIVFTFCGDSDKKRRRQYVTQFNKDVLSGTFGAEIVFSDQKPEHFMIDNINTLVEKLINIKQAELGNVSKPNFIEHTKDIVKKGIKGMSDDVVTYESYCDHVGIDTDLLPSFIEPFSEIDNFIKERNNTVQARIRAAANASSKDDSSCTVL